MTITTIGSHTDAISEIAAGMRARRLHPAKPGRHGPPLWLCALGLFASPMFAVAEGTATPYAAMGLQYNTNVFDLQEVGPPPVGKNGTGYSDTYLEARAGIEGTYFLDQQKFFGTAELRRFDYNNFTYLDHNENLFDGGLKWKLPEVVDGTVEYKHEERMVQFQDLATSTAFIEETENTGTASFNVHVTPMWMWENRFKDHLLDSPRLEIPGLSLHEDSVLEGVKYLGLANVTAGLEAEYLEGSYSHDPTALNPNYHQSTLSLAGTYILSGFTTFIGNVGYTERVDPTNSGLSGVTGSLAYVHNLTGKTTLNLQLTRALNTYVSTAGNELDTTVAASINWQATYKILVKVGYSYTDSKYPLTPDGALVVDRVDHFQSANVELKYQVLHWLSIRPYAQYQSRHSNVDLYSFNSNIVGVELLVKEPRPNPNR